MATRGSKAKPAHLRLVDGTHRPARHGSRESAKRAVRKSAAAFEKLTRPTFLEGEARAAWDRYIAPAAWLDASREPAAIAFCVLWAEFREAPASFMSSRHAQMRAYMSELGLSEERNRLIAEPEEPDEFFDD